VPKQIYPLRKNLEKILKRLIKVLAGKAFYGKDSDTVDGYISGRKGHLLFQETTLGMTS